MTKERNFSKMATFYLGPYLLAGLFLAEHYLPYPFSVGRDFQSLFMGSKLFYVPMALLTILASLAVLFPYKLYIHASFCFLWGLFRIMDGELTEALFLCLFGCLFLYRNGFFRSKKRIKLIAIVAAIVTVAVLQAILLNPGKIIRLFSLAEFCIIACFSVVILRPELKAIEMEKRKRRLILEVGKFNEKDRRILQKILDGEKYDAIANEEKMAISTFKKYVHRLFLALGVSGRVDFVALHANHEVCLEEPDDA